MDRRSTWARSIAASGLVLLAATGCVESESDPPGPETSQTAENEPDENENEPDENENEPDENEPGDDRHGDDEQDENEPDENEPGENEDDGGP